MSPEINDLMPLITLIGVIASLGGAWALVKYQIGELRKRVDSLLHENKRQWQKSDKISQDFAGMLSKVERHDTILDPIRINEHFKASADTYAEVKYLRRDVDELRAKGVL